MEEAVKKIIGQFALYGDLVSYKSFGSGHIHNTYRSEFCQGGTRLHYTHQRINKHVFKNPEHVIHNISEVTSHIRAKLNASNQTQVSSRVLTVVGARDGKNFVLDSEGEYWRTYLFIENSRTFEVCDSAEAAAKAGKAIGIFHRQVADYPAQTLHAVIPDFHNMRFRYEQFDAALQADTKNRAISIRSEIDFVQSNRSRAMILTEGLEQKKLPLRVVHNDAKLNNILFDDATGELLCVIDLDTIMNGTALFDTGDLIRTSCGTGAEDDPNPANMQFDLCRLESLLRAYTAEADFLTATERDLLGESGRTITHIMAVRFLTDYLNGDVYYKTSRPNHNLDRFHTQQTLIMAMDAQWKMIEQVVKSLR